MTNHKLKFVWERDPRSNHDQTCVPSLENAEGMPISFFGQILRLDGLVDMNTTDNRVNGKGAGIAGEIADHPP